MDRLVIVSSHVLVPVLSGGLGLADHWTARFFESDKNRKRRLLAFHVAAQSGNIAALNSA
jgi:hypothetical protein